MCTFSWLAARRGYDVFFDHDEYGSSGTEGARQGRDTRGAEWFCPFTSEIGTWLLVTSRGLTAALLAERPDSVDNGLAPPGPEVFAPARGFAEIDAFLGAQALARTRPFLLVAVHQPARARAAEARVWEWNHGKLAVSGLESPGLLLSSCHRPAAIREGRRRSFEQMIVEADYGPEPRHFVDFHTREDPAPLDGPFLNAEGEAPIRSFSRVRVRPSELVLRLGPVHSRTGLVRVTRLSLFPPNNESA